MKLYELTGEYAALQGIAEDGEDVNDALAMLTDALEVKAERIGALLRNFSADQDALRAEEKRLAARRKALENAEEDVRDYIRRCMEQAGMTRLKCAAFSFTLSARDSLQVVDEAAVPAEYVRTKVETSIDKKAALDAFKKHGECVPGTAVVTNNVLTIR